MNFLQYKNAEDFLQKTGLNAEQGLTIVEAELKRQKQEIQGG